MEHLFPVLLAFEWMLDSWNIVTSLYSSIGNDGYCVFYRIIMRNLVPLFVILVSGSVVWAQLLIDPGENCVVPRTCQVHPGILLNNNVYTGWGCLCRTHIFLIYNSIQFSIQCSVNSFEWFVNNNLLRRKIVKTQLKLLY